MMHNYEESEAELKAILEAEKWERCYEEYEVVWEDGVSGEFLDSKIPKGYYECDIYEPCEDCHDFDDPSDIVEFGNYDLIYNLEEAREAHEYHSYDKGKTTELEDYDIMQYRCEEEAESDQENLKVYHNGQRFVTQEEYDATFIGYLSEDELAEFERWNDEIIDSYPSKDEEREWANIQAEIDACEEQEKKLLEDLEKLDKPWEYYPEVLETFWKEDYGEIV